jgi:hypothetical protein
LEGHPAVPEADNTDDDTDDLPPLADDTRRGPGRHLHTPLPLDAIRAQAEAMTDIGVPGHLLGVAPADELLPLDLLRALIYQHTTPLPVRDAAWRYLIGNAIEHGDRWHVYVIGVAAMRLIEKAHWLVPGGKNGDHNDKRHVHQHLATGFLAEMYRVGPDDEKIGDRILWRTVNRAKNAWWRNRELPWPHLPDDPPDPEPVRMATAKEQPPDDELPDILKRLVDRTTQVKPSRSDRRPKLTADDAALIELCSLHGRTITEAAAELGVTADAARSKVPRAKRAIFTLLASDYLRNKHPELTTDPADKRRNNRPE